MQTIKSHLTQAKHTRVLFTDYWFAKKRNKEQLVKFLQYPWELQIGCILEFLGQQNINIFIFENTYDILLTQPIEDLPDLILIDSDGLKFITKDQKILKKGSALDYYLIACVTAINWLNFKKNKNGFKT